MPVRIHGIGDIPALCRAHDHARDPAHRGRNTGTARRRDGNGRARGRARAQAAVPRATRMTVGAGGGKRESASTKRKRSERRRRRKAGAVGHQWGKYGIISETDLYNKEQEFRAWLVEERKINPETISKEQTKKEFARFVEDYNTATLPHEKFYHMEAYERRMTALRSGEYVPPADDSYDPNADLRALQSAHKRKAIERDTYMSKEQLEELRQVQAERIQAGKMKLLGMDVKQNMGVRMDGTMFDG
ncbi:uncharacterized protein B0H18DRAFT_580126 [Fomitopsis serialis]|uniref:uncharacterized protein n=1 Tax=Fomitopsis serialis TaxID=139415 RepID=UPI002007424A|nr:uncharacterized protein B0H18DRAFT_580126 [Neoantrodia serialis]KAH9920971.1 hypothetical protein B0H18DRAFT_580126 [Neoantrodia serialis]